MRLNLALQQGFISRQYKFTTLRLSLVAGSAFVTLVGVNSIPFARFLNRKITLSDGSNTATGYIKSAGIAETLSGVELISWTNSVANPYETFTTSGTSITSAINTTGKGIAYSTIADALAKLFRLTFNLTLNSGTGPSFASGSNNVYAAPGSAVVAAGQVGAQSKLYTGKNVTEYAGFNTPNGIASDFSASAVSLQQVLTPDATGCVIVSTPGGVTQSWASDTGISPSTATYTVTISK